MSEMIIGKATVMPKRQGNNPKRRIVSIDKIDRDAMDRLVDEAQYTGSPYHKRRPADYGFDHPVSPRPHKSVCAGNRSLKIREAKALFRDGIKRGMFSDFRGDRLPKYVWAVDSNGHAYEAKLERNSPNYHGYELENADAMRRVVIDEWKARCRAN